MVVPLEMGWRHLLFENWPIDPELLDAHLPTSLTADCHDGSAWLSVIPFTNVAVRLKGVPRPLGVRLPDKRVQFVRCASCGGAVRSPDSPVSGGVSFGCVYKRAA
jgi:uncharacterized protein YqjF (DUF2071 family)